MAEQELKFTIIIEGQQANAVLQLTDKNIKQITQSFQKAGIIGTQSQQAIQKSSQPAANSISGINEKLTILRKQLAGVEIGSEAFQKLSREIYITEKELQKAQSLVSQYATQSSSGMQTLSRDSSSARMAMISLNYTLRDAPYLFQNLNMGIMAISNNIPMLFDGLIALRREAGSAKSFIRSLAGSLMGPAGLSIAFSGVIALIQVFSFMMGRASRETKKITNTQKDAKMATDAWKSSIRELNEQIDELTNKQIEENIERINKEIEKLEEERKLPPAEYVKKFGFEAEGKEPEEITNLKEKNKLLNEELKNRGLLKSIEIEIRYLRKKQKDAKTEEEIQKITDKIAAKEKERRDLLLSTEERLKKQREELEKQQREQEKIQKAEQEFLEQKKKLENELATIQGKKTELDVIKETEQQLRNQLAAGKISVEKRREIELQLLQLRIERIRKEKELQANQLEYQKNIADQELEIFAARRRLEIQAITDPRQRIAAEQQLELELLEMHKQRLEKQLSEEYSAFQEWDSLSEEEKKERIARANELEISILNIEQRIADQKRKNTEQAIQDAEREKQARLAALKQTFSFAIAAFNNIRSLQQQERRQAIQNEKEKRMAALERERKERLEHALTQRQKDRINQQYYEKREQLEQSFQSQIKAAAQKGFGLQKAIATAQAIIDTYSAANRALRDGGPILGPILAAIITAAGLANVAMIQSTKPQGYAKGGEVLVRLSNQEYFFEPEIARKWLPILKLFNQHPEGLPRQKKGGIITGPGGPKDDNILARVPEQSFIMNAQSTETYFPILEAISSDKSPEEIEEMMNNIPKYSEGGEVELPIPILENEDIKEEVYMKEMALPNTVIINNNDDIIDQLKSLKDEFTEMRKASIKAIKNPIKPIAKIEKYDTAAIVQIGEWEISRSRL